MKNKEKVEICEPPRAGGGYCCICGQRIFNPTTLNETGGHEYVTLFICDEHDEGEWFDFCNQSPETFSCYCSRCGEPLLGEDAIDFHENIIRNELEIE